MTNRFSLTAVAVLVAAGLIASVACANLGAGTKAPDFTLPTIDGKTFTLSDCFGKSPNVVVLDLWATWCPPCRAEIPYLVNLNTKFNDKGVMFIGVALDQEKSKVTPFVKQQGINYTVPLDLGAEKLGKSYDIRGIPATYVIDKKGIIRYVHSGFPRDKGEQKREAAKLESEIKTLLSQK